MANMLLTGATRWWWWWCGSLRTSETTYLEESFVFYEAIRLRDYFKDVFETKKYVRAQAVVCGVWCVCPPTNALPPVGGCDRTAVRCWW